MYESANLNSLAKPETKRKGATRARDNARRLRETLFFRLLVEGETSFAESVPAGTGTATGGMVPAWLHAALGS